MHRADESSGELSHDDVVVGGTNKLVPSKRKEKEKETKNKKICPVRMKLENVRYGEKRVDRDFPRLF